MEGYDVKVVGEVSNDLYCTICLKLMRDAIQMKCGHGMCQTCFQKLADSCKGRTIEIACPSCRQVVKENQIFQNMMLDRVIVAVKVKCSNHKLGCKWIGELQSSSNHLMTNCDYHMVKCPFQGCNKEMLRNLISEHETTCEYRVVQCDYCSEDFQPNQLVNHVKVCEFYPMKCKNEMCSELIPRCKIEEHLKLHCLYEDIKCSFHSIGCGVKFLRKDFNTHLHEFNQKHMLLLLENTCEKDKHIEALQEESRVVTQNAMENEKQLLIKIDELEKEIVEVKEESVVINGRLDQYKAQYQNVLGKLINIEQKFQDLTCLAPHELTGSEDNQKSVIAAEGRKSSMIAKYSHTNFLDGVQQLETIARQKFENDLRAPVDILLETFQSESKTHHEQWLSNDVKIIQGISDIKKAGLPLSESYRKIVIDAIIRDSKILNFQQISRMEKYCHLLSSNRYLELRRFENGENTVQIENHFFVRYQYSQLSSISKLKTIIKADNLTIKFFKYSNKIYVKGENVKKVFIINRHLQKAELAIDTEHDYFTASYNELTATQYIFNDWFLLEILVKVTIG